MGMIYIYIYVCIGTIFPLSLLKTSKQSASRLIDCFPVFRLKSHDNFHQSRVEVFLQGRRKWGLGL